MKCLKNKNKDGVNLDYYRDFIIQNIVRKKKYMTNNSKNIKKNS